MLIVFCSVPFLSCSSVQWNICSKWVWSSQTRLNGSIPLRSMAYLAWDDPRFTHTVPGERLGPSSVHHTDSDDEISRFWNVSDLVTEAAGAASPRIQTEASAGARRSRGISRHGRNRPCTTLIAEIETCETWIGCRTPRSRRK